MEEKKKLSLVIIILTTLLLGVFSYIGYDKFITKDNKDSNSDKTKENTENNSYNIYNMIYTSENSHSLAVNKDNTGYEEIAHNISVIPDTIIGIYNNNLYYSALDGVYYIDLSDSNYKSVKWLSYNQYKTTDNGGYAYYGMYEAVIIDNEIYFYIDGENDSEWGLNKISLNATSIDESIQINSNVEYDFEYYESQNTIYYLESYSSSSGSLYSYNLKSGKNQLLFEKVEDFKIYDDNILYYIYNSSNKTYDIYLYDIKNKEEKLIYQSSDSSLSGGLYKFAYYYDGSVYYRAGNSIMKYNSGKSTKIYSYTASSPFGSFNGFDIDKNGVIKIFALEESEKYIVDGNITSKIPDSKYIEVKMLDGTLKKYNIDDSVSSDYKEVLE